MSSLKRTTYVNNKRHQVRGPICSCTKSQSSWQFKINGTHPVQHWPLFACYNTFCNCWHLFALLPIFWNLLQSCTNWPASPVLSVTTVHPSSQISISLTVQDWWGHPPVLQCSGWPLYQLSHSQTLFSSWVFLFRLKSTFNQKHG